jgi:hypothetical protein
MWQRFLFTLEEAYLRQVRAESVAAAAIATFAAADAGRIIRDGGDDYRTQVPYGFFAIACARVELARQAGEYGRRQRHAPSDSAAFLGPRARLASHNICALAASGDNSHEV